MREPQPRPRWWYDRARQRGDVLKVAVERLHAALRQHPGYRNALIFGSFARNAIGPSSDLDVLAIVESTESQSKREVLLRDRIGSIGVPYDLVALTPAQFDRLRRRSFFRQALREGRWLDAT